MPLTVIRTILDTMFLSPSNGTGLLNLDYVPCSVHIRVEFTTTTVNRSTLREMCTSGMSDF